MRRVFRLSKRLLVCSVAMGLIAYSTNVQGKEMRWRPVAASGNVVCTPGAGDCGETEIRLSAGGVVVTLFLEVSDWDDDPNMGQCTLRACSNSGIPCSQQSDCDDEGICDDQSPCSVAAQDCADHSICARIDRCVYPECDHTDPNTSELDGGTLTQAADGFVEVGLEVGLILLEKPGAQHDDGRQDQKNSGNNKQAYLKIARFHTHLTSPSSIV